MVEQGGELQLLIVIVPCCFPHTRQPLGHANLALCRGRVRLTSVLLDRRPSLPTLRRRVPVFVRKALSSSASSRFSPAHCNGDVTLGTIGLYGSCGIYFGFANCLACSVQNWRQASAALRASSSSAFDPATG